jgi:arsenate reductase
MTENDAIQALGALAQQTRLRLFRLLVVAGPQGMTPSLMAQRLQVSPTALSFHLKQLSHAGLVHTERDGRHLIYRAAYGTMEDLMHFLTAECCHGQPCINLPAPHSLPANIMNTTHRPYNVLFLCVGNSARSIMAEAILNHLGHDQFKAYSAGSLPAGAVHPRALALLERNHYGVDGLRSKSWNEFAGPDAPVMDFVLTVCDKAAGEVCPVWPGHPASAHWGVADPVEAQGTEADIDRAFTVAFMTLSARISLLVNLPVAQLDRLALQRKLNAIADQTAGHT